MKLLGQGLELLVKLESLSLWIGWWEGIRDASTGFLLNSIYKLE